MITGHHQRIETIPKQKSEGVKPLHVIINYASVLQVQRHVPLNDGKVSQTTKLVLQNLLQEFDLIISTNGNDIGQTDLIGMHIPLRPHSIPIYSAPVFPST